MASTTLISTTSFGAPTGNYDGSSTEFSSKPIKGDGYLGRSDGIHTVAWKVTGFSGSITVQATLEKLPEEADWFDVKLGALGAASVDTTGLVSEASVRTVNYADPSSTSATYNFTGNFVWIRVLIRDFSAGTINFVQTNS